MSGSRELTPVRRIRPRSFPDLPALRTPGRGPPAAPVHTSPRCTPTGGTAHVRGHRPGGKSVHLLHVLREPGVIAGGEPKTPATAPEPGHGSQRPFGCNVDEIGIDAIQGSVDTYRVNRQPHLRVTGQPHGAKQRGSTTVTATSRFSSCGMTLLKVLTTPLTWGAQAPVTRARRDVSGTGLSRLSWGQPSPAAPDGSGGTGTRLAVSR